LENIHRKLKSASLLYRLALCRNHWCAQRNFTGNRSSLSRSSNCGHWKDYRN